MKSAEDGKQLVGGGYCEKPVTVFAAALSADSGEDSRDRLHILTDDMFSPDDCPRTIAFDEPIGGRQSCTHGYRKHMFDVLWLTANIPIQAF